MAGLVASEFIENLPVQTACAGLVSECSEDAGRVGGGWCNRPSPWRPAVHSHLRRDRQELVEGAFKYSTYLRPVQTDLSPYGFSGTYEGCKGSGLGYGEAREGGGREPGVAADYVCGARCEVYGG